MQRKQQGFTLLEIAISMAIIGLLLAMTIKGQEMIDNSRTKSLACDFKNIQTSLYGYQDKYRALPGDDLKASMHLVAASTPVLNGNGNMILGGNWNSTSGETFNFWQHVRLTGFAQGTTDTNSESYIPLNISGGALGISESTASPITGLKGDYIICSDNIAGKSAKQLDIMLDDGSTGSGSVRTSERSIGGAGIITGSIIDGNFYLVCLAV
jgi:prepilin-type N-terminal cleavage/methylation domain-containing protein